MDILSCDLKRKTKIIFPSAERWFRLGDRAVTWFKNSEGEKRKYSGQIVKVEFIPWRGREITIKTDDLVDSLPGALLEGYGLRGLASNFQFEGETREESELYLQKVEVPMTEDDFQSIKDRKIYGY